MSDDVTQFLQQVQQLKGRRAEEDEARSRELEEKILQEKSERAARRAERARSISPQKSSPVNTPPPPTHRSTQGSMSDRLDLASSPVLDSPVPRRNDQSASVESPMTNPSTSPTKENQSPLDLQLKREDATSSSSVGAKPSPLSWQRRPNSQSVDRTKSRPLSMFAAENAARTSTPPEPSSATETSFSKDQIAQALSSKDPAWFRQTSDRGQSSAAYRRNQVEDEERLDMSSMRSQLPGMNTSSSSEKPSLHSRSRSSVSKLGSPLDLTPSQRLDPPSSAAVEIASRSPERSPTRGEGRMSSNRPISPTKGLGGFVQSAMMKRSDSVKRWSVNSPPGLTRADSMASNRANLERVGMIAQPSSRSRPTSMIRDGSTTPTSRPTSRHGANGGEGDHGAAAGSSTTKTASQAVADSASETAPHASTTTTTTSPPQDPVEDAILPSSPSKTMDPRRWSPTKSSWLEAALNKPESPKPKPTPPPSNQPAWMVELNKAKAQKSGNPDAAEITSRTGSVSHKHEVAVGGLMRSPPIGTSPKPSTSALGSVYSAASQSPRPAPTTHTRSSLSQSSAALDEPNSGADAVDDTVANQGSTKDATPPAKPKPEAVAKMDFRANLKPRQPPPSAADGKGNGNEFQNVFGNLRKTKTQNFVAPDELKDNILRGKAGLSITGGPKKTERKDEFKEAILKKKKEMEKIQMEGKSVTRTSSTATVPEKPVPEGLAKRSELGRSSTTANRNSVSSDTTRARSSFVSSRGSISSDTAKTQTPAQSPAPKAASSPKPESVEAPPRRPSFQKSPVATPTFKKEQKESTPAVASRLSGRVGGGSLADRFNPALAGMLARGPPPMSAGNKSSEESGAATSSGAGGTAQSSGPGPQLTHMTKNRARGPRRKAPTSAASAVADTAPAASPSPTKENADPIKDQVQLVDSEAKSSPPEQIALVDSSNAPDQVKLVDSSAAPKPADRIQLADSSKANPPGQIKLVDSSHMRSSYSKPYTRRQDSVSSISDAPDQIKLVDSSAVRASYASSTPTTRSSYQATPTSKEGLAAQAAAAAILKTGARPPQQQKNEEEPRSQPTSPKKLDTKRISKFLGDAQPSPKPDFAPRPESPTKSPTRVLHRSNPSLSSPQPSSPTKEIPGRMDIGSTGLARNVAAMFDSGSPAPTPKLPAKDSTSSQPPGVTETQTLRSRSRSPTKVGNRPLPLTPGPASPPPLTSPNKQAMEVSALLNDFFGPERPKRAYHADAAEILMNRPAMLPVKSAGTQLFQIFGDGKKVPVPAHNERVLFEREMYICAHNFTDATGRKACEVYFWVGDEVPASTAEDVQVFVRNEAKALSGKVVPIRQGKETTEFIQALGGIVITRRGSSNKYDSLAPNMLCGRRYLGHVAFDEVDFSPASLCSGFAYLITQGGRCVLWKGKGSDVDELSCARLVGMDLTLTGELDEVDDGEEPTGFWDMFRSGEKPQSADHWRLKPSYDKYCARLYCSDGASKQQIIEIHPFSQADLRPTSIYVLDAFFEMYIIVGRQARDEYTAFRNALDFAQEYAILASGIEDRPFVPISTVVLEGIPRDLKAVFRKWRDAESPTIMNPPGGGTGLRRGRSLRIVPLTQALQAMAE